MSCDVPFEVYTGQDSPARFPQHHGGKSTALKGDMQGRRRIFLPIGNRRKRKKKRRAGGRNGRFNVGRGRNDVLHPQGEAEFIYCLVVQYFVIVQFVFNLFYRWQSRLHIFRQLLSR